MKTFSLETLLYPKLLWSGKKKKLKYKTSEKPKQILLFSCVYSIRENDGLFTPLFLNMTLEKEKDSTAF